MPGKINQRGKPEQHAVWCMGPGAGLCSAHAKGRYLTRQYKVTTTTVWACGAQANQNAPPAEALQDSKRFRHVANDGQKQRQL